MAELLTNTKTPGKAVALAELASELKTGETTAVLKAALGAPYTTAGETFHLTIDEEIVLAEVVVGKATELKLTRKQEKSTEANHTPGTAVWNYLTAAALERWRQGVANVLTYGADPSGATASDEALTKALAASKSVFFPAGTYLINEVHKITEKVEIYGEGEQLTTLKTARTPSAEFFHFEKAGCVLHDLRIVAPLTGVTENQLVLFSEPVYGESSTEGLYRAYNIETVGGWIQITFFVLGGGYLHHWRGNKPQKYALFVEGIAGQKTQLVQVTDCTIEMPVTSAAESACVRVIDVEALQLVHINTELGAFGLKMSGATKNSHITDCYFDKVQGTACSIEGGEGIYFNKTWFQCSGAGGGAKVFVGEASSIEDIFFDGCQFKNSTGENSAFWTQMTKEAYTALAAENKRGVWKAATEYKVGQAVESHEGFQECAKTMTVGEDVEPPPGATGLTIGEAAQFVCVTASSILNCGLHGIKIEKGAQKIVVANNLIEANFGYGVKIGKEVAKSQISNNNVENNQLGTIKNEASEVATNFVVFNTGFSEFLTATMSKPAEQPALIEGAQNKSAFGAAQLRTQIISYKTKAEKETKVKHNLNSTAVLSVVAYKYPASKFETKMQQATKTVSEFTVNSASELTIKWSAELAAKEEIAIIIQAA